VNPDVANPAAGAIGFVDIAETEKSDYLYARGQPILDATEVVDEIRFTIRNSRDASLETFPPSVVTLPGLVSLIVAQSEWVISSVDSQPT
jgi:hypothetical protein